MTFHTRSPESLDKTICSATVFDIMKLSGTQFQKIQEALLDGYSESELRRMLRVQMNINLDAIVKPGSLEERIHELIRWTENKDRVNRLIESAALANPGNAKLSALNNEAKGWFND